MRPHYLTIITALLLHAATVDATDNAAGVGNATDRARLVSAALAESSRLRSPQSLARGTAVDTPTDAAKNTTTPAAKKRPAGLTKLREKLASVERQRIRDSYREHQLRYIAARRTGAASTSATTQIVSGDAD